MKGNLEQATRMLVSTFWGSNLGWKRGRVSFGVAGGREEERVCLGLWMWYEECAELWCSGTFPSTVLVMDWFLSLPVESLVSGLGIEAAGLMETREC